MSDDDDSFGMDMSSLLAFVEEAEKSKQQSNTTVNQSNHRDLNNNNDDDFDSFELDDINAIMTAADMVEKRGNSINANTTSNYSIFNRSSISNNNNNNNNNQRSTIASSSNNNNNNNNGRITFGLPIDQIDPTPPPPPPPDTRTYHTFDRSTIPTWIYPTNYPIRGYQFNIVKKALFNNTLVALPTGLGKTLIAAVVMYNYYRWFPDSIMIFMAPTRPLVEQQIEACYKVCGIPQNQTEILMGKTDAKKRAGLWASKRVFYATPQIVRNDIASGICPSHKIVLLVVDEAHRATGGYAYTEVIQKLSRIHSHYRILALSATPGSRLEQVQSVVTNLRINNIEIRTEDSMDVQEFNFGKKIQRIVIRLDYTAGATGIVPQTARTFCEQLFIPVLERLKKRQFIPDAQPERWSPYALLSNQRLYQATAKNVPQAVKNMVFQDFSIAHSFSRAYENLCTYGIGSFVETVEGILQGFREKINGGKNLSKEQYKILNHIGLNQLLDRLRQQMESPSFVSHPKLDNLTSIIIRHLTDHDDDNNSTTSSTRIIIFSSLRNSVEMITKHLSIHKPLIRCAPFIGQGSDKGGGKGMNQKEQHETIQKLKKGEINVIVATSIGEEGLDIGEVDLIVCYDSQSSPIRMLQRIGRTGRKRQGHCVMLMTEQEERKYNNANDTYKRVQRQISDRNSIQYYENCPSVLPNSYQPVLQRKHFNIASYMPSALLSGKRKRQGDDFNKDGTLTTASAQDFLDSFSDNNRTFTDINHLHDYYWPTAHPLNGTMKYLPFQKELTTTKRIPHSQRTKQFTSLIQLIEQQILNGSITNSQNQDEAIASINIPSASSTLIFPKKTQTTELKLPQKRKNPITSNATLPQAQRKNDHNNEDEDNFMGTLLTTGIASEDNLQHNNKNNDNEPIDLYDMSDDSDMMMGPLITKGVMGDDDIGDEMEGMNDFDYNFDSIQQVSALLNVNDHNKANVYKKNEDEKEKYNYRDIINNNNKSTTVKNKSMIDNKTINPNVNTLTSSNQTSIVSNNVNKVAIPSFVEKKKEYMNNINNNDEFDDSGNDFFDNDEFDAIEIKEDGISKSPHFTINKSIFNFDDEPPPIHIGEAFVTVANYDFFKTFSWTTDSPVFSEEAKTHVLEKLKNKDSHQLLGKILSYCSSRKTSKDITTKKKSPPLSPPPLLPSLPSLPPQSPSFDDDIDIDALDDILDSQLILNTSRSPHSSLPPVNHNNQVQNSTSSIHETNTTKKKNSFIKEIDVNDIEIHDLELLDFDTSSLDDLDDITENIQEKNKTSLLSTSSSSQSFTTLNEESHKIITKSNVITNQENSVNNSKQHNHIAPNAGQKDTINNHQQNNDIETLSESYKIPPLDNIEVQDISHKNNDSNIENTMHTKTAIVPNSNNSNKINSPNSLLNEISNHVKDSSNSNLFIISDDSQPSSPIIQSNKSKKKIFDETDGENDNSLEDIIIKHPTRLKKRIIEEDDDDDADDDDDVDADADTDADDADKNKNQHHSNTNRNQHKRKSRNNTEWSANPFLDMEAERSDDGIRTGDEDDLLDEDSSLMESFIYDGSSELRDGSSILYNEHRQSPVMSSATPTTSKHFQRSNDLAIYRNSLLQPSNNHKKKGWLDRIDTEKWEKLGIEDDDEITMEIIEEEADDNEEEMEEIDDIIDGSGDISSDFM